MNADTLVVESRLESKLVPRDRVACLIWLHDETGGAVTSPSAARPSDDDSTAALRVQAIRSDGVRLTFVPRECTGTILTGASQLLGACRVELNSVDALILGPTIDSLADEQAFQDWQLSDAPEPRYVLDAAQSAGSAAPAAAKSGLVGKPAPDFQLELLEGGEFRLSEQKGRIVVLDFWASWCGPCMQSMPQVDAVVSEFAEQRVTLVAVNMQEDRAAVTSALERLKIKPTVVLDIDGAAAGHYQVTAIPQTVIVGADGNVAHLFIGAGADFPAQLRTAISGLLGPRAP
jgi:thiol-disulfide isomerase/thioredoxin